MNNLTRLFCSCIAMSFCLSDGFALPFVAPPEPSGTMQIKLYPTENVVTGTPHLVTFGVPFTRGSIADVSTIRVLKNNVELPAFVETQTPWRHFYNNAINGQSVRIARIQISYTFSVQYPLYEVITIEWGKSARTQNASQLTAPRTAWHPVTSGSFVATDSVWEPDVYAVLPKEVMCLGTFKPTRMSPWVSEVADTLDKASWLKGSIGKMTGYSAYDFAQKNLTYSYMGKDKSGGGSDYMGIRTDYSAWLFDRPSTIYMAYFRGGGFDFLREGVRNFEYYQHRIYRSGRLSGAFIPKNPTPSAYCGGNGAMYSYLECMEYTYWLTGDDSCLPLVPLITDLYDRESEPTRWSPQGAWGQERHTAFEFLANICAFEVTGEAKYRTNSLRIMGDYIWHQNGAGGKIDSILGPSRASHKIDGALYHFGWQHASDWEDDSLGASPWMYVLAIDAIMHLYHMEESDSLKLFFKRYGSFLARIMQTYDDVAHGTKWIFDPYVVLYDGSPTVDMDPWSDPAHTPEIGASIAWGNYFADILGAPDSILKNRADVFYKAAIEQIASASILPGSSPEYRVNSPSRLLAWQMRTSQSWSWLGSQNNQTEVSKKPMCFPATTALLSCFPNPFNPETKICFSLVKKGKVNLSIYGVDGRLVETLLSSHLGAGNHSIIWAAKNVASGIYVVRMVADNQTVFNSLIKLE